MTRLLRTYPQFSREYIEYELPMMQGWAFHAAAIESDGWNRFAGVKLSCRGYVGQEIDSLVKIAREFISKQKQ